MVLLVFLLSEYTDDEALVPNNTSVIIRRIPAVGLKSTNKRFVMYVTWREHNFHLDVIWTIKCHWCFSHLISLLFGFAVVSLKHHVDLHKQYVEKGLHWSWCIITLFGKVLHQIFGSLGYFCTLTCGASATGSSSVSQINTFVMFYNVTQFLIKLSGKAVCLLRIEGKPSYTERF